METRYRIVKEEDWHRIEKWNSRYEQWQYTDVALTLWGAKRIVKKLKKSQVGRVEWEG